MRDGLSGIACKDIDIEVYGLKPDQMKDVIGKDIKYVKRDICAKKAMEIVVDSAVVTEYTRDEEAGEAENEGSEE